MSAHVNRGPRLLGALAVIAALVLSTPASAESEAIRASEYQIKAAFLLKFGSYVEWPAASFGPQGDPYIIGVLGAEEITHHLLEMARGQTVAGRPVQVRPLVLGEPPVGIQVLFIGKSVVADLSTVLDDVRGEPVLVVTETDETPEGGGVINFVTLDNKVRFDVTLTSAHSRKLKISSRLLVIARHVIETPS